MDTLEAEPIICRNMYSMQEKERAKWGHTQKSAEKGKRFQLGEVQENWERTPKNKH